MKTFNILVAFLVLIFSCKGQETKKEVEDKSGVSQSYITFGNQIDPNGAINNNEMAAKYSAMAIVDTVRTKFSAKVTNVCQVKGCWMKLELKDGQETMVRFKDYGFFMPKDIVGKEVIVNGLGFVEEMSVEDQKHYAKDSGKSDEEITKITKPKKTYAFEADGVLLKK